MVFKPVDFHLASRLRNLLRKDLDNLRMGDGQDSFRRSYGTMVLDISIVSPMFQSRTELLLPPHSRSEVRNIFNRLKLR